MRWIVKCGNILDEPADVLVCSANGYLNLSGGVGGEILVRHGDAMQRELHQYLTDRHLQFVPQGTVVRVPPCGTPYKAVLHAVAVDGFYDSSPSVVEQVVARSLEMAAALGARRVALVALATGFGHLSPAQLAQGVRPLTRLAFPPVEEIIICVLRPWERDELAQALPEATVVT